MENLETKCKDCGRLVCEKIFQAQEWISVKDKLPELNSTIISSNGEIIAVTTLRYNDHIKKFYWDYFSSGCGCCDTDMTNVTHWMPLPLPPKDE